MTQGGQAGEQEGEPFGLEDFRSLIEQIPAIVYMDRAWQKADADPDDPEPRYLESVYVSPQVETILGISVSEWLGKPTDAWLDHLHPDDRGRTVAQYEAFLEGGSVIDDFRIVRPDGRIVWIRDRGRSLRNAQGEVVLDQGFLEDVTELKKAEIIVARQVEMLRKIDAIGREFSNLVLRGADTKFLLQSLSRITKNPAVLEDAAHQLVEYAVHEAAVDEVLRAWDTHSREGHPEGERGVVLREEGDVACLWIHIRIRDESWGYLHVLEIDREMDEVDQLAVDRAAAAIGMSSLSDRDASTMRDRAGSSLVNDLLRGAFSSPSEILQRTKSLGADLDGRSLVALAVEPERGAPGAAARARTDRERLHLTNEVVRQTRRVIYDSDYPGIVAPDGDRALAIVGLPPQGDARSVSGLLGADICQRVAAATDDVAVVVGVSETVEAESLGTALELAGEAASHGARAAEGSRVFYSSDLGVQHLLANLAEGPALARFVEAALSPLLRHDSTSNSPLMPTLRVVLAYNGRKQPAARVLHIERRTLYHRIARIERLLGQDLDDHATRVRLDVALAGLDVLQRNHS